MAYGKAQRFPDGTTVLYFKLESKDLPKPRFKVTKKEGDGYVVVDAAAEQVSGNIIDIDHKETLHEGKKIKSADLVMQDGNEVYSVGLGYTHLGRNIINSLLSLTSYDGIQIGLYQSKAKPGQTKTFASASVRQNGGPTIFGK